jgi:Arc/MetJ-type ribon-helix-helix transcriptional regulator
MPKYRFNLSQRVDYSCDVEAPSRIEALRKLIRDLQEADGEELDLAERDSGPMELDELQTDEEGDEIDDPEFIALVNASRAGA